MEFYEAVQAAFGLTFGNLRVFRQESVWYADTVGAVGGARELEALDASSARAEAVAWLTSETSYRILSSRYTFDGDEEFGYTYLTGVVHES